MLIEERVTNLEEILAQTLRTVEQTSRELRKYQETSRQEMQAFKEEMRQSHEAFQKEMNQSHEAFREEMTQSHKAFREEMRQSRESFRQEMHQLGEKIESEIQESRAFRVELKREMNRRWGEFSRIIGRMAEDLVAPSIPRVLRTVVGCPSDQIDLSAVHVKKRYQNRDAEFDVIAVCGDYVLINETKNKLRSEDIKTFAEELLPTARDFFPEYMNKKFIGAIASLYVDERQVKDGERRGVIVLGFGEDVMEVLNTKGFVPKVF
jgi:DNA repair exonuclease SbcCD ATPase subunit